MFTVKAQCDYTLEMNDSWGDGWDTGSMSVYVDGMVVLSGVTTSDSQTTATFEVTTGSDITTTWDSNSSYSWEVSWRILDSQLNEVFTFSGNGGQVTTGTLTGSCPSCGSALATMSAITTTGATATWGAATGAASYDWEVVPTGNAQGTGVVASGSGETGLTVSITGLTSNTAYDFLISSDCTTD